ncbi:MAG: hypothetical protein GY803_27110 [Chloroflexi bacterium]|nr:hypothetical protein [Chloroflexota bacterium]
MTNLTLRVYVADDCWSCLETRRITTDIASQFPEVAVELLALDDAPPDDVFAVPTYLLNGRVIFLGNPTREELSQKLTAARQTVAASM